MTTHRPPKPPKHLRPATRRWWSWAVDSFEFEEHHVRLLTLACEALDRGNLAREALERHGQTFVDRFGQPRGRPELAIVRDSAIVYARLVRELRLDVEPDDGRAPGLNGGRRAS
jgi:phage terminase small subunit